MLKISRGNVDNIEICTEFMEDSWIDLVNPTNEEIQRVSSVCHIDSSIILQVLVEKELPRVKKFNGGILTVIDIPYMKDKSIKNKYVTYPLGVIICDNNYILTVSLVEYDFLNKFKQNKIESFDIAKRERFLMQIFLNSSNAYLCMLDDLEAFIHKIEKTTYHSTNNKQLLNFLDIQNSLVYFITSLRANSVVFEKLQKEDILFLDSFEKMLLEDAVTENKQCIENTMISREILSSTIDAYGTIISNNLNVIMKFLTGITIVFSVPTMISSFFGMNVPLGDLGKSDFSFLLICIVSFALSFILACWLKKKNML